MALVTNPAAAYARNLIVIVPAIKRGARNAQLIQRLFDWQVRTFNKVKDLKLFRCGVSHSTSPPSAIMLF
jgi:hypothetical protein